jgi:hypothetical protein
VTTGTAQTFTGVKTINADWVNTANPWADNEVADNLTISGAGSVAAAAVQSGSLGAGVIASSVAVNSVTDSAVVSLSASKLTGALPAIDGSALTGITATNVASNAVGTTQIIDSTVALVDLNTTDVDTRYVTTGTAQTFTGVKTINADWVNTANPWADNEVADVLTVATGSTVTLSALAAGSLPANVIASSIADHLFTSLRNDIFHYFVDGYLLTIFAK